jgi:hypothetical protein
MKWLAFFVVMGLSGSVVRRLDWPAWLQVVTVILVNLVTGAVIFSTHDQGKRGNES